MMRRIFCCALLLCLLPLAALAARQPKAASRAPAGAELFCPATAVLGEPFVVRVKSPRQAASASLSFLGRSTPLSLRRVGRAWEAHALLGADVLDGRPGRQEVRVVLEGKARRVLRASVEIRRVARPVESLTLDPAMVNAPDAEFSRIVAERAEARKALGRTGGERLWSLPLHRPAPGEVSSIYGIERILNGVPKSPHRGLDLEAATGQPVSAAAGGVVALTGAFYYAGNCVYLDHGQGLVTMYFHLSEVLVAPGERVARGQVVGLAGDTGRSTRSHLHFGVSALGRLVDPAPLFLYDVLP